MLYVIYGNDIKKARSKLHSLLDVLKTKQPDAETHRLDSTTWKSSWFDELLQSQGLFLSKYIVVVDRLIEDKNISDEIVARLKEMKASQHMWIVIEEKILAGDLKKIKEHADKFMDFDDGGSSGSSSSSNNSGWGGGSKSKDKKAEPYNLFNFAEQCAGKNKVGAWKEFDIARQAGVPGEEVCGILWWQFKAVHQAGLSKDAKSAGLSPFVFSKSQKIYKLWSLPELNKKTEEIILMYHRAHRGEVDLMDEIEKFVLGL